MAKKKSLDTVQEEPIIENISIQPLEEVMGDKYAIYARCVIQDRAIPDVRDGLKPVQRRIIFSMYKDGNTFNKPTRKCAHTVGAVMGTFHPHGDSSIYEALARMSQDWKVRYPLVDFQGNNGSIDGDSPAAYRYTESRLSELSNELVKEIDKNTVDMQWNFDDTEKEPIVLPSRFPNLLCNGTEGIAVAIATEIPPHNLCEVIDATIYRINHKTATIDDLMQFIQGPDFPGGGVIYKSEGLSNIYHNGRGRIEVGSKCEIVDQKNIQQIIVTEIPYKVVKSQLVYEIDTIRHSKAIDGIIEVRDESDWQGIRIAIDLKKEAKAEMILAYLMNKTSLKTSYSANMVAICSGKPKTLSLLDFIDSYIAHQVDVVTRQSKFDLNKYNDRLHIVEGLLLASLNINDVVEIIKHSNDKADSKINLMNKYSLSAEQAEAIVTMPLYKLSHTDETILLNEKEELLKNIEFLNGVLADPNKLNRVLCKDLKAIKDKYGDARRTQLIEKEEINIDKRELIAKEDVMVAVTYDGYVKRSTIKSYRSSGVDPLPGIKDGDLLIGQGLLNTTDYIICFTNLGNFLSLPVHKLVENKWKDEGEHINKYLTIAPGEKFIKVIGLHKLRNDLYLGFLTKSGQIKRMCLNELDLDKHSRPVRCMKLLSNNDSLVSVEILSGNSDLLVLTNNGYASCFNENELTIVGLKAGGVKSISGLAKNQTAGLLAFNEEDKTKAVILTDKGHERIIDKNKVTRTQRLGKTTCVMPLFKSDIHKIISMVKIPDKVDLIKLNLHFTNNAPTELIVDDFHLTDMTKYAKKNANTPARSIADHAFLSTIDIINDSYVSKPIVVKEKKEKLEEEINIQEETSTKEEDNFEQISIFDDLE